MKYSEPGRPPVHRLEAFGERCLPVLESRPFARLPRLFWSACASLEPGTAAPTLRPTVARRIDVSNQPRALGNGADRSPRRAPGLAWPSAGGRYHQGRRYRVGPASRLFHDLELAGAQRIVTSVVTTAPASTCPVSSRRDRRPAAGVDDLKTAFGLQSRLLRSPSDGVVVSAGSGESPRSVPLSHLISGSLGLSRLSQQGRSNSVPLVQSDDEACVEPRFASRHRGRRRRRRSRRCRPAKAWTVGPPPRKSQASAVMPSALRKP